MSELTDLYQEMILDHSRKPHNFRTMDDASKKADGYNPLCGDQVTVFVKLDGEKIQEATFQGQGCAISKSSASIMTDAIKGKTRAEAEKIFERFHHMVTDQNAPAEEDEKLAVFSGVSAYPTRVKCAVLAWHTLRSALNNKQTPTVSTE